MSELSKILRAEGLDAAAIARVRAKLAAAELILVHDWNATVAKYREERANEKKAMVASAMPYAGAITQCQANVFEPGRGGQTHRCCNRAKFAVRRGKGALGVMAVCRVHAADRTCRRFTNHWNPADRADEVVEKEYQTCK